MARPHARSGQLVSVLPLAEALAGARTAALLKASQLELVRIVLHAGESLREHAVEGEVTLQCIEGRLTLGLPDGRLDMVAGDFIHPAGGVRHSLAAHCDSSALLTICLTAADPSSG